MKELSVYVIGSSYDDTFVNVFKGSLEQVWSGKADYRIYCSPNFVNVNEQVEIYRPDIIVFLPLNNAHPLYEVPPEQRIELAIKTIEDIVSRLKLPVIAFSGISNSDGHYEKVIGAGALACFPVPFTTEGIRGAFEKFLVDFHRWEALRKEAVQANKKNKKKYP
jgi:AmiR/NasT family two-component response regulator